MANKKTPTETPKADSAPAVETKPDSVPDGQFRGPDGNLYYEGTMAAVGIRSDRK